MWIQFYPHLIHLQRASAAGQDFCAGYPGLKILPNPLCKAHVSIGTSRIKQGTNPSSTEQGWKSQIQRICKELHNGSFPEPMDPHSHVLVLPHVGQGLEDAAGIPKEQLNLCRAPLHGSVWDRKQQSLVQDVLYCVNSSKGFTFYTQLMQATALLWEYSSLFPHNDANGVAEDSKHSKEHSFKADFWQAWPDKSPLMHALILTQSLSKAWQQRPPQSSNFTHKDLITWNSQYILKGSLPLIILQSWSSINNTPILA